MERTVHHGKLGGNRRTFILAAKLSSFVEVLGLYGQVEMDFNIWEHIIYLRKASITIGNTRKGLLRRCGLCLPGFL